MLYPQLNFYLFPAWPPPSFFGIFSNPQLGQFQKSPTSQLKLNLKMLSNDIWYAHVLKMSMLGKFGHNNANRAWIMAICPGLCIHPFLCLAISRSKGCFQTIYDMPIFKKFFPNQGLFYVKLYINAFQWYVTYLCRQNVNVGQILVFMQ